MKFDSSKESLRKALLVGLVTFSAVAILGVANISARAKAAVATAAASAANAAKTATIKTTTIAVLDLKKVAAKSKAGEGIEEQAAAQNNTSKRELIDLENKIKSMESNKLSGLDPRKIEELQLLLYDMVKEKRFQISEAYRKAIEALESIIKEVVKEICSEKHIDIVITNEAVIYCDENCIDITEEVIRRLDEHCKEIVLKVEENSRTQSDDIKFAQ